MKILVVYFSRTGHTRSVAVRLARELGAAMEAITERRSRHGLMGYQRSLYEATLRREPEINPLRSHPRDYDLVLIGTPVWGWQLASPVRSFARRYGRTIRRTAFFCTMGGSGDRRAFAELERLVGRPPEAVLALTEAELYLVSAPATKAKVAAFTSRLLGMQAALRHAA